jgi:lysophospholipase L1-like esterase
VKRGLQAVLLVVASVAVTTGVLEGITRALALAPALPPDYGVYEAHEALPFRKKPSHVSMGGGPDLEFHYEHRTNSDGLRDVERPREKPPGVFRILGLGDSYTEGAGVPIEESYLYRLERMLQATPGLRRRIEVIKAGQGRYWTEPERLMLEVIGIHYQPDLILVGFTPNDVTDTYIGWNVDRVRDGYLVTREAYELGSVGLRLYLHSHLARLALRPWVASRLDVGTRGTERTMRFRQVFQPDGYHEPEWLAVESELARMIAIARSNGAAIVLVHIPTEVFQWPTAPYAGKRLAAFGARHGVPVVDTLPALRAAAATGEAMYWKRDIHCTPAGYRVIAETIHAALLKQGLVPVNAGGG